MLRLATIPVLSLACVLGPADDLRAQTPEECEWLLEYEWEFTNCRPLPNLCRALGDNLVENNPPTAATGGVGVPDPCMEIYTSFVRSFFDVPNRVTFDSLVDAHGQAKFAAALTDTEFWYTTHMGVEAWPFEWIEGNPSLEDDLTPIIVQQMAFHEAAHVYCHQGGTWEGEPCDGNDEDTILQIENSCYSDDQEEEDDVEPDLAASLPSPRRGFVDRWIGWEPHGVGGPSLPVLRTRSSRPAEPFHGRSARPPADRTTFAPQEGPERLLEAALRWAVEWTRPTPSDSAEKTIALAYGVDLSRIDSLPLPGSEERVRRLAERLGPGVRIAGRPGREPLDCEDRGRRAPCVVLGADVLLRAWILELSDATARVGVRITQNKPGPVREPKGASTSVLSLERDGDGWRVVKVVYSHH